VAAEDVQVVAEVDGVHRVISIGRGGALGRMLEKGSGGL